VKDAIVVGADYIGCGPTFASSTKAFESFSGLDFLQSVVNFLNQEQVRLPAFAIGGITIENLPNVLATGARRIAVSHAVWKAESPSKATEQMRHLLDRGT
jgi:thiamine-phosphate pyrophosphorylase